MCFLIRPQPRSPTRSSLPVEVRLLRQPLLQDLQRPVGRSLRHHPTVRPLTFSLTSRAPAVCGHLILWSDGASSDLSHSLENLQEHMVLKKFPSSLDIFLIWNEQCVPWAIYLSKVDNSEHPALIKVLYYGKQSLLWFFIALCCSLYRVEGCIPVCPPHMVLDEVTHRCVYVEDCEYQWLIPWLVSVELSFSY